MTGDELDLTDLIDEGTATQGAPPAGLPGGHHYWCPECGGFRTHEVTLTNDKRMHLKCRVCEHEAVLVFVGGVWTNEALSGNLRKFLGARAERLLREFDSALVEEISKPEEESRPGAVEAAAGAAAKRLGILGKVAREDVDKALDGMRRRIDVRAFSDAAIDEALGSDDAQPEEAAGVPAEGARPPRGASTRRRAKVAVGLVSAPFLLMGALYILAWRGTYIWPIYYAIKPYYQPWMNEPWFYGLSVAVPALAVLIYIFTRGRGRDVGDSREESPGW